MRMWVTMTVGGVVLAAAIAAGTGLIATDLDGTGSRPVVIDGGGSQGGSMVGSEPFASFGGPVDGHSGRSNPGGTGTSVNAHAVSQPDTALATAFSSDAR